MSTTFRRAPWLQRGDSWLAEFQRNDGEKGPAVVGVSLDDHGWKVVTPFVKSASIPYEIVVSDEKTAKDYGISSMPETLFGGYLV